MEGVIGGKPLVGENMELEFGGNADGGGGMAIEPGLPVGLFGEVAGREVSVLFVPDIELPELDVEVVAVDKPGGGLN